MTILAVWGVGGSPALGGFGIFAAGKGGFINSLTATVRSPSPRRTPWVPRAAFEPWATGCAPRSIPWHAEHKGAQIPQRNRKGLEMQGLLLPPLSFYGDICRGGVDLYGTRQVSAAVRTSLALLQPDPLQVSHSPSHLPSPQEGATATTHAHPTHRVPAIRSGKVRAAPSCCACSMLLSLGPNPTSGFGAVSEHAQRAGARNHSAAWVGGARCAEGVWLGGAEVWSQSKGAASAWCLGCRAGRRAGTRRRPGCAARRS